MNLLCSERAICQLLILNIDRAADRQMVLLCKLPAWHAKIWNCYPVSQSAKYWVKCYGGMYSMVFRIRKYGGGGKWKCAYTTGWLVQPEKLDAGRRTSLVAAQQVQPCYQSKPKPSFVSSRRQVQPGSTLVPVQTRTKFIGFLKANVSQYKVQKLRYNPIHAATTTSLFCSKQSTKQREVEAESALLPFQLRPIVDFLSQSVSCQYWEGLQCRLDYVAFNVGSNPSVQSTFSFEWVAVLCTSICDGIF